MSRTATGNEPLRNALQFAPTARQSAAMRAELAKMGRNINTAIVLMGRAARKACEDIARMNQALMQMDKLSPRNHRKED